MTEPSAQARLVQPPPAAGRPTVRSHRKLPAPHWLQAPAEVAPIMVSYAPDPHETHAVAPTPPWYELAGQG